jgi:hypothetical protein
MKHLPKLTLHRLSAPCARQAFHPKSLWVSQLEFRPTKPKTSQHLQKAEALQVVSISVFKSLLIRISLNYRLQYWSIEKLKCLNLKGSQRKLTSSTKNRWKHIHLSDSSWSRGLSHRVILRSLKVQRKKAYLRETEQIIPSVQNVYHTKLNQFSQVSSHSHYNLKVKPRQTMSNQTSWRCMLKPKSRGRQRKTTMRK